MKLNLLYILEVLLLATIALCQDDDELNYQVMHKLNSQKEFIKRGDIKLKNSKSQTGKYTGLESNDSAINAKINKNDLYLVEVRDTNGNVLSSSYTKACFLFDSKFKDEIILHVDSEGKILFADYFTEKSTCPEELKDTIPVGSDFKTSVRVLKSEQGQRPHLASLVFYKREQAKKQMNDKGFFAKYWMYILPVVLIFLFSGA
ncbi:hypothetical protein H8356DRAFT_976104 [Neocallimastix lanati (nom. inval.)]|jgi:hypothetical protein|uniref:ER membrane protein complex subunit 10 n=1 Tax=Neocallimastix californiae TaxID=1754190 RepID=A0A1Y2A4F6_9FUNG|nr:hypothetical protein H8356DRAFT_976104 [Neocallimastix sp. JGI-2020a]ORY17378.1 hypothetical protein LY90DRAFT_677338 [Neocallimastix californiae]|eukprot:ORY17378.1 hypothetical protein LY90DRAFT_677338 [Neocallimastix californiae]